MSFSQPLRTLRTAAGLTRAEAARRARDRQHPARLGNDRGFPPLPAFRRLAGALGVPVERLAEGEDPVAEELKPRKEDPRQ